MEEYQHLKKAVEILKTVNEKVLQFAILDENVDVIILLLSSHSLVELNKFVDSIVKFLPSGVLLDVFNNCHGESVDTVRKMIIELLFKFNRIDVFQHCLPNLAEKSSGDKLLKILNEHVYDIFFKAGTYGAFETVEFIISNNLIDTRDNSGLYHTILDGYINERDESFIDESFIVKKYFTQFVFPRLKITTLDSENEAIEKISNLQNLIRLIDFSSLDLFIFFFRYICQEVNNNSATSKSIAIGEMVTSQSDPIIVSWLLKNYDCATVTDFLTDNLLYEEHVDLFSVLISAATNSRDFSTIQSILFNEETRRHEQRKQRQEDQLVRLCIRNAQLEKLVDGEKMKEKITCAKNILDNITQVLSLRISCAPLVQIILLHF